MSTKRKLDKVYLMKRTTRADSILDDNRPGIYRYTVLPILLSWDVPSLSIATTCNSSKSATRCSLCDLLYALYNVFAADSRGQTVSLSHDTRIKRIFPQYSVSRAKRQSINKDEFRRGRVCPPKSIGCNGGLTPLARR